jgi:hypothetical protein
MAIWGNNTFAVSLLVGENAGLTSCILLCHVFLIVWPNGQSSENADTPVEDKCKEY